MTDQYFINDIDIWNDWGLFPPRDKGFYKSLLKAPARKYLLTKNWADQNGTQRAFSKVDYENREMELPFVLFATSREELLLQYNAIKAHLYASISITLTCIDLNRQFILSYKGMPTFNKLTPFYDDGNIAVELSINVVDEHPTVFKDKDGVLMSMPFPPDVPDGEIDFNVYDFNIIEDGSIVMSGNDVEFAGTSINGNDLLSVYGLMPQKGFDNELLKLSESKGDVPLKFETRLLELPFILQADNDIDFYYKYYQIVAFFLQSSYFNLDISYLNRRFALCYSDMPSIDKLSLVSGNDKVLASFKITCFDDYPTIEETPQQYDGLLTIDNDANLVFSQSEQYEDKIDFEINDDNNLVVITY